MREATDDKGRSALIIRGAVRERLMVRFAALAYQKGFVSFLHNENSALKSSRLTNAIRQANLLIDRDCSLTWRHGLPVELKPLEILNGDISADSEARFGTSFTHLTQICDELVRYGGGAICLIEHQIGSHGLMWMQALRAAGVQVETLLLVNGAQCADAMGSPYAWNAKAAAWREYHAAALALSFGGKCNILVETSERFTRDDVLAWFNELGAPESATGVDTKKVQQLLDNVFFTEQEDAEAIEIKKHLSGWSMQDQTALASTLANLLPPPPKPGPHIARLPQRETGRVTVVDDEAPSRPRRRLLLHYHIFKNAGTSLDLILKRNFSTAWHEEEFHVRAGPNNMKLVRDWIENHPQVIALSSHTAKLPTPRILDVDIFPILMLRHPLVRIWSAYHFERKQDAATQGATLAKAHDFAGYVSARMERKNDIFCRNCQAHHLALAVQRTGAAMEQRALMALDELPFVGVVELFDDSMNHLRSQLLEWFPEFKIYPAYENARSTADVSATLREIEAVTGKPLFERLIEANSIDLNLHTAATQRLLGQRLERDGGRETAHLEKSAATIPAHVDQAKKI